MSIILNPYIFAAGGGGGGSEFWSHSFTTPGDSPAFGNRLGIQFTVGASDLVCNTLSYFGAAAPTENIRIHRNSDDALIAEANIPPVIDAWADATVAEFTLVAGVAYTVSHRAGGTSRSIYRNPTGLTFDPGITVTFYVFGSTDDRPTSTTFNAYVACRFGYV